MMLEISRAALDAIRDEAAASPTVEVCGLLLGEGLRVNEVRSCRNVADDPAATFEIDPAQLIAAHRAAREGQSSVIGNYHSHPNGNAEPSASDAAAAHDGQVWVIVGDGETMAWLALDSGQFECLPIQPSS